MNEKGYTLLEILVALTIVGIIFSIGYVGFRSFSQRQEMQSVARNIRGDLRLAQGQALAGKKPPGVNCDSPATLDGFNFSVDSATTYSINAVCSGGLIETKSVSMPSGITITPGAVNPIVFKIIGNGTNITGQVVINITQTGTTNTASITVTEGGEIQ